jgi:hypothetical protein
MQLQQILKSINTGLKTDSSSKDLNSAKQLHQKSYKAIASNMQGPSITPQ